MIRINLLGQARPKARGPAVPAGATVPVVLLLLVAVSVAGWVYFRLDDVGKKIKAKEAEITHDRAEKSRLEGIKREVEELERQRAIFEQRKNVIDQLSRNRTGGQELLDVIAGTVTRTDGLWLTNMTRKGSSLTIDGTASSVNAVANFITQLKRSGYFGNVEIKETRQDERNKDVAVFLFSLTADFVLPDASKPAAAPAAKG